MKADHAMKSRLPGWLTLALSMALALTITGSGLGSVSASTPQQGGRVSDRSDSPAGGIQYFEDIPPTNPFFVFANTLYLEGLISGYPCGGPAEPCGSGNRPYYRPGGNLTRGQMAKIISTSQNFSTNDILVPIKIITNKAGGVGIWGGTGGAGPSHDPTEVNAGVYGNATGSSNSVGVLGESTNDNAAMFVSHSNLAYSLYVPSNGADIEHGTGGPTDALHVGGHLTVTGGCTGCTVDQVMLNTGTADLHPGDVVVLGAVAPRGATVDGNTVGGVTASTQAYDTAVVGVVGFRYVPGDANAVAGTVARTGGRDEAATVVKPGDYMTVVTQGTVNLVKVDAGRDGIRAGDLLTTGSTSGVAMKASDKLSSIGALLGKAMGNLDSGTGYIPVLITLK
jgi:hypothetical protein